MRNIMKCKVIEVSDMDMLTVTEVAKICRVTRRTVLIWIDKGLLAAARLPGKGEWRIRRTDLEKTLEPVG